MCLIQCVPRKGFGELGSAVSVQRYIDRVIVVSQTADPNSLWTIFEAHTVV